MNDGNASSSHPLETALGLSLKRLLQWGIPLSVIGLVFKAPAPDDGLLVYKIAHLLVLQVAALVLAAELAHLLDRPWFATVRRSWMASAASLIAVVTGFSALLTLATSAAARYEPSLQFLQLLSSLDIAWVTAALFYGAWKLWGRFSAWMLASLIVVACVASIAAYLNVVGFADSGGWLVDGSKLWTIVIPADMAAATVALSVLLVAGWRSANRPSSADSSDTAGS